MELGGYKLDQTAEFIGKGASVTTRPITFIKGMFLHTDHEVDQENANVLQDCQGAFHIIYSSLNYKLSFLFDNNI